MAIAARTVALESAHVLAVALARQPAHGAALTPPAADRETLDGNTGPQVSLIDSVPITDMPIAECCKLAWLPFVEVMTFSVFTRRQDF
jgi:hypothetical protein